MIYKIGSNKSTDVCSVNTICGYTVLIVFVCCYSMSKMSHIYNKYGEENIMGNVLHCNIICIWRIYIKVFVEIYGYFTNELPIRENVHVSVQN